MSRFRKLTHAIWHCQYHILLVPKYHYSGTLTASVTYELERYATVVIFWQMEFPQSSECDEGYCDASGPVWRSRR